MTIRQTLNEIMFRKQNNQSVDELITKTLVNKLTALDFINSRSNIHIYGRTGTGGQSFVPWVGIMNKELTISVTESIYLVYLFSQNGQKVYLSLNQGVTYLDQLRKEFNDRRIRKLDFFEACSKVLLDEISEKTDLITGTLTLVNNQEKDSGGRSYQHSNIIALEYKYNQLPDEARIKADLALLLEKYEELQSKVGDYHSFIKENCFKALQYVENTNSQREIKETKLKKSDVSNMEIIAPKDTFENGNKKNTRGSNQIISDKQLRKKLKEQQSIGDLAESEVLEYFRYHIKQKFGEEKAKQIVQVSKKEGHGHGHDITAFDLDSGEEIYIEVKGTKSTQTDHDFFMTKNELEKLIGEKKYRIVRVFGVGTGKSKIMIYGGFENYKSIEDLLAEKINAEPINFRIKGIKIN